MFNDEKSYQLLTVDIWGTLLERVCHPDCSKLASSSFLALFHEKSLKEYYRRNSFNILRERRIVERELYTRSNSRIYNIEDVLSVLLSRIFNQHCEDRQIIEEMISIEVDFDFRHSHVSSTTKDLCNYISADKKLYLSDFYIPEKYMSDLFNRLGVYEVVSDGIISVDVGFSKYTGAVYQEILKGKISGLFNIDSNKWLHIGDDVISDQRRAKEFGIKTIGYSKMGSRSKCSCDSFAKIISAVSSSTDLLQKSDLAAYNIGLKFSPIFVGFSVYIAEKILLKRLENIYFCTREGEFFLRVWRALFRDSLFLGEKLPFGEMLEVSRMSTYCAAMESPDIEQMRRLWNVYPIQSIRALALSLGLNLENIIKICQKYDINFDEPISNLSQDYRIKTLFDDEDFSRLLNDKIKQSKKLLLKYVTNVFDREDGAVGVVDIGWRGSILDNLARVMPKHYFYGIYLGLFKYKEEQLENVEKTAFLFNENKKYGEKIDNIALFEILTGSASGSVIGYAEVDGSIVAMRDINKSENSVFFSFTKDFQQGVIDAAHVWAPYIQDYSILSSNFKPFIHEFISRSFDGNYTKLMKELGEVRFNENFGLGRMVDKYFDYQPGLLSCLKSCVSSRERGKLINYISDNQYHNFLYDKSFGIFDRLFLHILILFGRQYKARVMNK